MKYLLKKHGKEKLVLIGHSWGSMLGAEFASKHPEYVSRYIGVAQIASPYESEKCLYNIVKEKVQASDNEKDKKILSDIGDYPFREYSDENQKKQNIFRRMSMNYVPAGGNEMMAIVRRSPVFGMGDFFTMMKSLKPNALLMRDYYKFEIKAMKFEMPVDFVLGENDTLTNVAPTLEYFEKLEAPEKNLTIISGASHMPFIENVTDYRKAVYGLTLIK